MADIFISYAHADKAWARALADLFAERKWTVWWDPNIQARESFRKVITEELEKARCVVVLWSPTSAGSEFVASEAARGQKRDILVGALIEETAIPVGLDERQAISLIGIEPGSVTPEVERLIETIAGVLEQPAPPPEPYPLRFWIHVALLTAAAIGTGAWLYFGIRPQVDGRLFIGALVCAAALCAAGVFLVATRKRSRRLTWILAAAMAILGLAWAATPAPLVLIRVAPGKNLFGLSLQTADGLAVSVYRNGAAVIDRKPFTKFETIYLGPDTEDLRREIADHNGNDEHKRQLRAYLRKAKPDITDEQIAKVTDRWITNTTLWATPALRRSDNVRVELRKKTGEVLDTHVVERVPGDAVATVFLERPPR